MKITIVKKGSTTVKPMGGCPWIIEVPPEPAR